MGPPRRRSFLDVRLDSEDRSWFSAIGIVFLLGGIFLLLSSNWDRLFPDVNSHGVPEEARIDGFRTTESVVGDAGSWFGPWILVGLLLAVAGLGIVVGESRRTSRARARKREAGNHP